MVRHHVAQRAGRLVELAALLDADRLGRGDLHMVDVVAVPDRLEQAVGEAQRHDVLDRLLAEEMVDPVDLASRRSTRQDVGVQRLGRGEVVAERLLDHHAPPALLPSLVLVEQPGLRRAARRSAPKKRSATAR